MFTRKLTFLLLLLVGACIDPLTVHVKESTKRLIVDGMITNREEQYQVKLFYSLNLATSVGAKFNPASNATVLIVDEDNNATTLYESESGIYKTPPNALIGEVGKYYHLIINTEDGKTYQSRPQQLTSSGSITGINLEFVTDALPGPRPEVLIDGLRVLVDAKGVEDGANRFRWRWTTIFKAKALPELKTRFTLAGTEVPDPEPCSGYVVRGGRIAKVGDCTCCICWVYTYSNTPKISQSEIVSDNEFKRIDLGKIPATAMQFYDRYYIEVEQLSLSSEAYTFWNLVQKQLEGATDIFQPNSIRIKGNIECTSNPDEEVLGFFSVSGIESKSFYISPEVVPYTLPLIDSVRRSCLGYYKGATTEKPIFW